MNQWVIRYSSKNKTVECYWQELDFHIPYVILYFFILRIIMMILTNQQAKLNSALSEAAKKGDVLRVQLVIKQGADIHQDRSEAFRWAVSNNHTAVVQIFLDLGVDVNSDQSGALELAVLNHNLALAHLLLKSGADTSAQRHHIFFNSIRDNDLSMVKLFVQYGANIQKGFLFAQRENHQTISQWLGSILTAQQERDNLLQITTKTLLSNSSRRI